MNGLWLVLLAISNVSIIVEPHSLLLSAPQYLALRLEYLGLHLILTPLFIFGDLTQSLQEGLVINFPLPFKLNFHKD